MVISHIIFSVFTGILIGALYGLVFSKGKTSSAWLILLLSIGRYALLVAVTLLINMIIPLNLFVYVTGFFCAFWLFIHKTMRMGL